LGLPESSGYPPATTISTLDLNELIQEVLALTQYEVLRSRIAVHTELTAEPVAVHGDPVQLQQVLLNLLLNAIEAIDAKTEGSRDLIIRSRTTGRGQIEVSIHDSGIGIALPHMDQIFNAFFTTKSSGMGMGLSISRSAVEAHGGRLWAVRNEEGGATFQFSLPAVNAV
jgi:signal transduction histidine kinase